MKKFTVPTRDQLSASSQAQYDNLQKAIGFVPNLYATFGLSEHGMERYVAFQGAKTSLNNKEKEAVNLVVSQINDCRYCLGAHTAMGKMNGLSDADILGLRAGHSADAWLDALVKLAADITNNKGRVAPAILEAFYAAGYTDGNLVDVVLQVSEKIAANYLHNLTDIPVDFPVAAELEAA